MLLLVLCCCCLWLPCQGMVYLNQSFQVSAATQLYQWPVLGPFTQYTWQTTSSGSLWLSVTLQQPIEPPPTSNYSMQVVLCSRSGLSDMGFVATSQPSKMYELLCMDWNLTLAKQQCAWAVLLGNNSLLTTPAMWSAEVELRGHLENDWYTLIFTNCGNFIDAATYRGSALEGQHSLVAQSSPGEYLSVSDVPYKSLYIVASCVWLVLLLAWAVHLLQYRHWNVRLQLCMLAVPLSRIWLGVPFTLLYLDMSRTGLVSTPLMVLRSLSDALDDVVLFTVLLLIGKGWCIVHDALLPLWKKEYVAYVALMAVTYAGYWWRQETFVLAIIVVYLLVFRYVFTSVMHNTIAIINGLQALLQHPMDPTSTPLWHKLHMSDPHPARACGSSTLLLAARLAADTVHRALCSCAAVVLM